MPTPNIKKYIFIHVTFISVVKNNPHFSVPVPPTSTPGHWPPEVDFCDLLYCDQVHCCPSTAGGSTDSNITTTETTEKTDVTGNDMLMLIDGALFDTWIQIEMQIYARILNAILHVIHVKIRSDLHIHWLDITVITDSTNQQTQCWFVV